MDYVHVISIAVGIELLIIFAMMHIINNTADELRLLKIRMDQQEVLEKELLKHVNGVLEHDSKVLQKCSDILEIDQNINDEPGIVLQRYEKEKIDIQKGKNEETDSGSIDIS